MASSLSIEKLIREAIERGEFENLRGEGKPIDLNAYFATPEDIRLGYSVLKSNDYVPEEVAMLNELAELKKKISNTGDESEAATLRRQMHDRDLALRITLERNKRRSP